MNAIPYVDSLIKEYLLFRGFTGSLRAFNRDIASDRGRGFQADQLSELIFRKLLPLDQASELMEVLEFLSSRVYSRLPGSYEGVIRKLEVSILRAYIVKAVQDGKLTVVQAFFSKYGQLLLQSTESADWLQWFALPYLENPSQDPRFQVYFSKEWLPLVELSFRNFLAEAIEHLPLPTLLCFDTDRLQRSALQKQVERLQTETAGLRQQLAGFRNSSMNAPNRQDTQQSQQHQQSNHETNASRSDDPVQHHFRSGQNSKAPAPAVASKQGLLSQSASSNACDTASVAEDSEWVLANGQENSQSPTANELAAADRNHSLSPQADAHTKPRWSASLASLAASVLANGEAGSPHQQAPAAGESSSLDADVSSLHLHQSELQLSSQADLSELIAEGGDAQSAKPGSARDNLPVNKQQTPARFQQQLSDAEVNRASQHQGQEDSRAGLRHRQTDNATELASSNLHEPAAEQLAGHDAGVTCCSFSPNGQNLATASTDGVVRISAPASLQSDVSRAAVLHCGAPVSAVAWDHRADKVMLVGTHGRGVKAWHLDTKSMLSHIQLDPSHPIVLDIACSPTDPSFVCASDARGARSGSLTIWNMRAFKKLRSFDVSEGSVIGSTSFSPDGRTVVTGASDGSLQIYDVQSSRNSFVAAWTLSSQHKQAPAVKYCADGLSVVSLSEKGQLQQWDLRRLSSKKLGQPQWTVDLSQFHLPLQAGLRKMLSIAHTGRVISTNSIKLTLPVVTMGEALKQPSVRTTLTVGDEVATSGRASSASVCAVHWHPSLAVLCCGLSNGQVWCRSLKI